MILTARCSHHVSPVLVDECLQECRNAAPPADLRLLVLLLLLLLLAVAMTLHRLILSAQSRANTREVVAVFSQVLLAFCFAMTMTMTITITVAITVAIAITIAITFRISVTPPPPPPPHRTKPVLKSSSLFPLVFLCAFHHPPEQRVRGLGWRVSGLF
jgi:hypothetical protein